MRNRSAWCLLFNVSHLRIVDARRLYSRRYIEFDLDLAVDDDRTFSVFCWIAHARRFIGPAEEAGALQTIVAASERHAAGVSKSLKDGVLAASTHVLALLSLGYDKRTERAPVMIEDEL